MKKFPEIYVAGDSAMVVLFGNDISPVINDQVFEFVDILKAAKIVGVSEIVPTYCSVAIYYDPEVTGFGLMKIQLGRLLTESKFANTHQQATQNNHKKEIAVYLIPVFYGGDFGPDIDVVAEHSGLSGDEVIRIHSSGLYRVYMIGYSPGFPYLGGMDSAIGCPRRSNPRELVPAGSVGIAESETGIYPTATPGGWQLIGCTPVRLFDTKLKEPALLNPGDYIRFINTNHQEYDTLCAQVEHSKFVLKATKEYL